MRPTRTAAALAVALALLAPGGVALADGDPASDVLLSQNVFLPYSSISRAVQNRLYAICDAARASGYPIRVALIGARSDLGVVPALFGRPDAYARFLSSELTGVVNGPVLVVMPNGFGLASQGRTLPSSPVSGVAVAPGTDGLADAAIVAIGRLSAAAGHPLAPSATMPHAGPGPGTVRHALIAIAILSVVSLIGIGSAFTARNRRAA